MIGRLIKLIGYLALLAVIGFFAFAYVGPLVSPEAFVPQQVEVSKPVDLSVD